jgi:hypothetical protein
VLCGGLWRSGPNRRGFLLPTVFEVVSEALVGSVDGGCGICFAPSGDSACAVDPEFQPRWVLHCFHGDRLGVEHVSIGG